MVRAKFQLNRYETTMQSNVRRDADGNIVKDELNQYIYDKVEVRTLIFNVVTSGSDENKRFFASTPSGEVRLQTVNEEVWRQFEINKEYYLDFTPADV